MEEIWKAVVGYEKFYEVSSFGRVKSLHYKKKRILILGTTRQGYRHVSLSNKVKIITKSVHKIVLESFIGLRPKGLVACHRDGCRTNNHIENLRWDTRGANELDKVRHGTKRQGETINTAKLKEKDIIDIRRGFRHNQRLFFMRLSKKYSVEAGTIKKIINGKSWAHL